MKLKIHTTDSGNKLEATLEQDKIKGTLWEGFVDGYHDDFHKITIQLDESNNIKSIQKGGKILTLDNAIKKDFSENFVELSEKKIEVELSGIEDTLENPIVKSYAEPKPYDPELIRVEPKNMAISYVFEMMTSDHKDLDLSPDFQRRFVWTDITRKSRLIESILLRIPLPVFYLSQDKKGILQVVDGVQRLTVIRDYLLNKFKLKNLEYLDDCENCYFDKKGEKNLDSKYIRRIRQTQLIFNIIDPQTPPNVKFEIFKRINTGGKPLNNQEIRNCLANSQVRSMLKEITTSKAFLDATNESISDIRMADQELVMRFIGFYYLKIINNPSLFYKGDMDQFLDDTLELLNKEDELIIYRIKKSFFNAMNVAHYLFGDYSFRKCKSEHLKPEARRQLINKSLFTSLSVILSQFDIDIIMKNNNKGCLIEPFAREFDTNQNFYDSITIGTNDRKRIDVTFDTVNKLIIENMKV